ncbi:MAG: Do family serine endopeptidase [Gemmatimonadaceae bacterium]
MSIHLSRTKIITASVIAFAGGVFFASSMDWTDRVFAQAGTAKPPTEETRPMAESSNAFVTIAEHITPAVVSIQTERDARARPATRQRPQQVPPGFEEFFRQFEAPQQQPRLQQGSGSGFIVSRDGYILTNNHVVEGADRVIVKMTDRRELPAKVVGRDPTTDVAVLKIEGKNFTTVAFGDDEKLRIGEWVLAIGNPLGLDFTVTAGIVSAKGRGLAGLQRSQYDIHDMIQTDAAINPGNSGGPLVNSRGEVIGINSAIASQTGYYSGYGFAIPITLAKLVMEDLISYGESRRAVIGVAIAEVQPEDAQVAGLSRIAGVKVGGFTDANSPAVKAGMEPGDIITKADGRAVDRVSELQRVIRAKKAGDVVELEAMRYGTRKSFRVRLGSAPTAEEAVAAADAPRAAPAPASSRLGISVVPMPAELIRAGNVPAEYRGLLIAEMEADSPMRDAGVVVGQDVIVQVLPSKKKIQTTDDLQAALAGVKKGEIVSFLVYRPNAAGTGTTYVANIRTN